MTEETLPFSGNPDIDRRIALDTPFDEVVNLCAVNKTLAKLCQQDYFWFEKLQKDFKKKPLSYRDQYLREVQELSSSKDHGLLKATSKGYWDIVIYLLEKYRDSLISNDKQKVLIAAIQQNQPNVVSFLLDEGYANVDEPYVDEHHDETSPLFAAIEMVKDGIARILLDRGAITTIKDLSFAIATDNVKMVKLLLARFTLSEVLRDLRPHKVRWLKQKGLI